MQAFNRDLGQSASFPATTTEEDGDRLLRVGIGLPVVACHDHASDLCQLRMCRVRVPNDVEAVIWNAAEGHAPQLGVLEAFLDVHQEAVSLDLLEADRRIVRRFGLDVLLPRLVGVDVEAAAVCLDQ